MGISNLWDEVRKASKSVSPLQLAKEGYLRRDGLQSFRVGVDASIWLVQGRAAEQAALHNGTMHQFFHKLCKLWNYGYSVVLVFDGPNRPNMKRGKYNANRTLTHELQAGQIADAFGFLHYKAPGEAEAELALLSSLGVIDAVITDDSDALVFGAARLIRNWSAALSGSGAQRAHNKANTAEDDKIAKDSVTVYESATIKSELGLDKNGLILMALMSGGDYAPAGITGCGHTISAAMAKAGFGEELVEAYRKRSVDADAFSDFLYDWRQRLKDELTTNSLNFMSTRKKALANTIDVHFPDLTILGLYAEPVTSANFAVKDMNFPTGYKFNWAKQLDVEKMVEFCYERLAMTHEAILKKFDSQIVPGYILYNLRVETVRLCPTPVMASGHKLKPLTTSPILEDDSDAIPLCHAIKGQRHSMGLLEFRLLVHPVELFTELRPLLEGPDPNIARLAERKALAKEARDDECERRGLQAPESAEESDAEPAPSQGKGKAKAVAKPKVPGEIQRIWVAGHLLRPTCSRLIEEFEDVEAAKAEKKAAKASPKKSQSKLAVTKAKPKPTGKAVKTDPIKSKLSASVESSPVASSRKPAKSHETTPPSESDAMRNWMRSGSMLSDEAPAVAKSKTSKASSSKQIAEKKLEAAVIDLTSSPVAPTIIRKAKQSRSRTPEEVSPNKSPRKSRSQYVARPKVDTSDDEELPDFSGPSKLKPSLIQFRSTKPGTSTKANASANQTLPFKATKPGTSNAQLKKPQPIDLDSD